MSGDDQGNFAYAVETSGEGTYRAELISAQGEILMTLEGKTGSAKLSDVRLWNPDSPTMYSFG